MSPPESVPVRAAIADDEPLARRLLRGMLEAREGVEVVGEAQDGAQAVALVTEREPDVLFLDVQMPGMDGFQVIEALALERLPRIVFVTAFDEYALRAFEVHALDYLLKPFDEERLEEALRRVREGLRASGGARPEPPGADSGLRSLLRELARRDTYAERLAITRGERTRFLPVEEVDWIEAAGKYVKVHAGGEAYPFWEGISAVEERLDPRAFVRVHRSHIVRLDRVKEVQQWFKGEYLLILEDGTKLRTGRAYRQAVNRLLGKR